MRWIERDNSIVNNIFLVVIAIFLLFMCIYHLIFLLLFIPYLAYILFFIKKRNISIIVIICLFIVSIHYILMIYIVNNSLINNININAKVVEIKKEETYNKLILKKVTYKIYVYTKKEYDVGDIVNVVGIKDEIDENTIENGFNYKRYLKYNKVLASIHTDNIEFVRHNFSITIIREKIKEYVNKYFKDEEANLLVKGFIIGDKDAFSDELNNELKENGIMHLFAISGLHLTLLIAFISKLLRLFNVKENKIDTIIIFFLIIYLVITNFTSSIVRASLMYFFAFINKKYLNKVFSSLDVASISFIVMIFYNPFYIFQTGFQLSYLASFAIILISDIFKDTNKYLQILYISIITNIITLPIIINLNYEINILSPILNVLYISLVSSIILPFTFIVIIFPIFSSLYQEIVLLFLKLIHYTSYFSINVQMPHFNAYIVLVYILFLFIFFKFGRSKRIAYIIAIFFVLFLCLVSNFYLLYQGENITYLYLNNGECTIIRLKSNVIIIDTGDGYQDEVYDYLKSKGIKRINYLFITHNHDDHYGGFNMIYNNIKINNIIVSKYNYAYYRYLNKTIALDVLDEIKNDDIYIKILSPKKHYEEENDNSLVFVLSLAKYNYNILFLGDATINMEEDILNNLDLKIDTIKIAHHGSKTANSKEFLSIVKPSYAIIMAPKKWIGTLPSIEVLNYLNSLKIKYYCTLDYYSITYDIRSKKYSFVKE